MLTDSSIQTAKMAIRSQIRVELKKMTPEERSTASAEIRRRLESQEVWRNAKTILFYAPLPEEVDVWPLLVDALVSGRTVLLPRFVGEDNGYVICHVEDVERDMRSGKFGVREPLEICARNSLNHLDLILAPGIAFDLNGHRLGRGKGYYDRLLAMLTGPKCGAAFDQQIVSQIPVEPHDIRLNCILTPTRWRPDLGDPRKV
jgi:5-formyltetrahydrofolate cyclo-ligase